MHTPVYRRTTPALALLAAFAAAGLVSNASAQVITKANSGSALHLADSYQGGVVPTIDNTLLIDNTTTIPAAGTLTSNIGNGVTVGGINFISTPISNLARSFTIGATGTGSLTIGAGGITKAENTSQFLIAAPIILAANQTWTINPVTGAGTNNLAIQNTITDGGFTANVTGNGRIDITGGNTFTIGNGVNLETASVVVNSATVVVTLGNANRTDNFQVIKGRAIGSVLANHGTASSFGDGGTNTPIFLGGGAAGDFGFLEYTGGSASSNRIFNFDRRTSGSEIRNTNASSTLTLSGEIRNNQGTSAGINSAYSFGGAGNITLIGTEQLKDNTDAGFSTTLNKNGTGTLTITGANSNSNTTSGTFQGATNVNAGLLVVSGTGSINSTSGINVAKDAGFIYDSTTALTKAVTLASGSRFGGDGMVNTNINIGSGVKFVFDPSKTLDLTGTLTLADTFGLDDLVNAAGTSVVWSSIDLGTYTLVNSTTSISFTTISNLGFENLLSVTADKNAYFQLAGSGSDLQLVVSAIPEPSTYAAFAGLGALGLAAFRRRRRAC